MRASKKVKGAVLLTAGAALFLGAPTVYAAGGADGGDGGAGGNGGSTGNVTSTNSGGLLSGLQLLNNTSVDVPATVCGVGAILALGSGNCDATAGGSNGGEGGDGGGAIAAGGTSKHSSGGTSAEGGDGGRGGNAGSKGNVTSSGAGGILSGLQVGNNLDLNVPVTACGVGALLARGHGNCDVTAGGQNGGAGGDGGRAIAASKGKGGAKAEGGDGGRGGNAGSKGNVTSVGSSGILSGAQVLNNSDLNIPITLCGVALLAASAGCDSDVSAGGQNGGAGGDGGGAVALGGKKHGGSSSAEGGDGGRGGNAGSTGNVTSSGAGGILSGLQVLNNSSVNVPVTVCGLALLGAAGCEVEVSAGGANGGNGGHGGRAISVRAAKHWDDDDSGVGSRHRDWEASVVRSAHRLPHTGAAGLALIPFGMALVAGGFALRRRSTDVEA